MTLSYPVSLGQRLHAAFAPIITITAIIAILRALAIFPVAPAAVSWSYILAALGSTLLRLAIAYALALVVSIPLALLVAKSPLMERIFLPLFDIAQSIPVLAFFPIVIIFFLHFGLTNAAAIFIIFITMLWTMVFSLVGGLKTVPNDIKYAAQVFDIRGGAFTRKILLPAIVPYLVTGSILTWAQGWNVIIVAEVLRTYLPPNTTVSDPFGIGSVLVNASANGETGIFLAALFAMVILIALLNFFVWQKLLHYAERYRFE